MSSPHTGEMWWAAPDPSVGRAQAGRRSVLIVSNFRYYEAATTFVVTVPITSVDHRWPNHMRRGRAQCCRNCLRLPRWGLLTSACE